jgi:FixJ family two-component response regulator
MNVTTRGRLMLMKSIADSATQIVFVLQRDRSALTGKAGMLSALGLASRGFTTIERFLEAIDRQRPACAVISARVPGISWMPLLDELGGRQVHAIVIDADDGAERDQLMSLGAVDAAPADFAPQRLGRAIERAFSLAQWRRQTYRIETARQSVASLSPREREVLAIATRGLTCREAAGELGLSPRTVEMHRASMLARLGLDRIADALRVAYDAGLVPERRTGPRY